MFLKMLSIASSANWTTIPLISLWIHGLPQPVVAAGAQIRHENRHYRWLLGPDEGAGHHAAGHGQGHCIGSEIAVDCGADVGARRYDLGAGGGPTSRCQKRFFGG